jgi:hypothetical protein
MGFGIPFWDGIPMIRQKRIRYATTTNAEPPNEPQDEDHHRRHHTKKVDEEEEGRRRRSSQTHLQIVQRISERVGTRLVGTIRQCLQIGSGSQRIQNPQAMQRSCASLIVQIGRELDKLTDFVNLIHSFLKSDNTYSSAIYGSVSLLWLLLS